MIQEISMRFTINVDLNKILTFFNIPDFLESGIFVIFTYKIKTHEPARIRKPLS
jgi:hypothetical protein